MKSFYQLSIIALLVNFSVVVSAQSLVRQEKLLQLSREYDQRNRNRKTEALRIAKALGLPVYEQNSKGQTIELQYFENKKPRYYITDNLNAAKTLSTDRVWPSGGAALNLDGAGQVLGEWDAGAVRLTHHELSGRVTQMDGELVLHAHSTHVAGTMIASGVDANAKGMSYAATLHAYEWDNDESEMAAAAAAGLKVSNHSYGYITGWFVSGGNWYWNGWIPYSATEDYGFGYYDASAQSWDNIAFNAPGYLIVKSAGNDRGEGPSPGTGHYAYIDTAWTWSTDTRDKDGGASGYDCISYNGTAKNILTVGAVNDIPGGYTIPSDVVMSSFSGWGPTDDGRIKPDIVGNGIGVYSSLITNDSAYGSYNGTSMASPNIAGSIGLLLQHKENLDGESELWLAATMKALIIHTADEAGTNAGPDYIFGWGLMNTESAAELMTTNFDHGNFNIRELDIPDGGTYQTTVYSDGISPLKATIVWTDPAGTPATPALDPTDLMLVNDLDMRITDATPVQYFPYILDPVNPANAATTADNFRDNVEQIFIDGTNYGEAYTISISHKGILQGGGQTFSLIISGAIANPSYTWIGTSDGAWSTSSNWSPARTNPNVEDLIHFEDGGTYTITSVPSQTIGQMVISNNTKITLQAAAMGDTLSIGDVGGYDLMVDNGTELNISGTNDMTIYLPGISIATFSGSMTLGGGAHKFIAAQAGGITFNAGAVVTASAGLTGNPFGASLPDNAVIFSSGSTFVHQAGDDPFGATQPNSVVDFQTGSLYKLTGNLSPSLDGRTYGNFEIDAPGFTINGTGSNAFVTDNLTITNGTFNLNVTGTPGHSIKGNINVAPAAALNFQPAGNGTINLNGSSIQTIGGGGSITGNANSNWVINNQVIADNYINLNGSLTINSGKSMTINAAKNMTVGSSLINNAGNTGFVLKSDATGTASLLHNSANVDATIERFITGSDILTNMIYHQVSIPINSSSNPTSSLFLGSYLYSFTENGETNGSWLSLGSSTTTPLDVNKGYLIYYPDNTDVTYSFSGPLRNGTVIPPVTFTDGSHGFNLIPNPYPSAIDWDAPSGWTRTNVDDALYIWNSAINTSNYGSYVGNTSTNGVTNIIPSGQAFFIRTNAASPAINMDNSVRVHDSKAFMKSSSAVNPDEIHLFATSNGITDEIAIRFTNDVTSNFDSHADAYKFYGRAETPQLNAVTPDGTKLSINSLPYNNGNTIVPLEFSLNMNAEAVFTLNGLESFGPSTTIFLEDKLLNKTINLMETPAYVFMHDKSNNPSRFNLRFNGVLGINEPDENDDYRIWLVNDQVNIYLPSFAGQKAIIEMYDLPGHLILSRQLILETTTQLPVKQFNGIGIVKIITGNNVFSERVIFK
jgi:hypothetical protein